MSNEAPNNHDHNDDLDPVALDELASILGDAAVWDEADPADEAAVLAAIEEMMVLDAGSTAPPASVSDASVPDLSMANVSMPFDSPAPVRTTSARSDSSNVISISRARRWAGPFAAGIAAALALVVGIGAFTGDAARDTVELALDATDLAPGATGVVEIAETPNGTVLVLDVSGLPPAPEGSYYEAWVRQDAAVGVSAGTFHLRGGGGEVELWAGVSTDEYPLFTITIQDEADPVSSGQVVLRGLIEG